MHSHIALLLSVIAIMYAIMKIMHTHYVSDIPMICKYYYTYMTCTSDYMHTSEQRRVHKELIHNYVPINSAMITLRSGPQRVKCLAQFILCWFVCALWVYIVC